MKQHLLSTGNQRLAQASPFDPVWGIGLRADDPEAQDSSRWRRKKLLREALSAVRDTLRSSEAGLTHPASCHHFCNSTTTDRIHEIPPAPPRPLALAAPSQVFPWRFRPFRLTRWLIPTPRFWLSHLVSTPPSRCQNTVPASSTTPLLLMTPLRQPTSRFTADLAFLHLLVAWRFLILAPHRLLSDEIFSLACSIGCCGIHHVREEMYPSCLGGGWRINPSEDIDKCAPERPIYSQK